MVSWFFFRFSVKVEIGGKSKHLFKDLVHRLWIVFCGKPQTKVYYISFEWKKKLLLFGRQFNPTIWLINTCQILNLHKNGQKKKLNSSQVHLKKFVEICSRQKENSRSKEEKKNNE